MEEEFRQFKNIATLDNLQKSLKNVKTFLTIPFINDNSG